MTDSTRFHALHDGDAGSDLIVVDIGYSAKKKSCGLLWTSADKPVDMAFGEAIDKTVELLNSGSKYVLVLEAVLSTFHSPNGNPCIRGNFEQGRGWYYGPGVLSFVAAMRFLHEVAKGINLASVPLAEAFLSNKVSPTSHGSDARVIYEKFWHQAEVHLNRGVESGSAIIQGVPTVRDFSESS